MFLEGIVGYRLLSLKRKSTCRSVDSNLGQCDDLTGQRS